MDQKDYDELLHKIPIGPQTATEINIIKAMERTYLTKDEIKLLYDYIKQEYVSYTNGPITELIAKIQHIALD